MVAVQGKARMLISSSQETKKKEQDGQGLATIESIPPTATPETLFLQAGSTPHKAADSQWSIQFLHPSVN